MMRAAQCDALHHEYTGPPSVPGNRFLTLAGSILSRMSEQSQTAPATPAAAPPVSDAAAGPERSPLCFIIDEESSIRHFYR